MSEDIEEVKQDVLDRLKSIEISASKSNQSLVSFLYKFLDALSRLILAYNDTGGIPGWSATVQDASGATLFTEDQQHTIESLFPGQKGGSKSFQLKDHLQKFQQQSSSIGFDDISFDKTYDMYGSARHKGQARYQQAYRQGRI